MKMTLSFICFSKNRIPDSEYAQYEDNVYELLNMPKSRQFMDKYEKQIKSGIQSEINEGHNIIPKGFNADSYFKLLKNTLSFLLDTEIGICNRYCISFGRYQLTNRI